MKQTASATNQNPAFEGTVQQLAGKIEVNGEALNLQEVQFLTRIGRVAGFAEQIGTAEGTGTRGGKRAIIWRIKPGFRVSLAAVKEATSRKNATASKGANADVNASAADPQPGTKAFRDAVSKAVAQMLSKGAAPAPAAPKRRPGRPAKSAPAA